MPAAEAPNGKSDDKIRDDVTQIARGNECVLRELRAAMDVLLTEGRDNGDLSPKELLRKVLKFGEEAEDE